MKTKIQKEKPQVTYSVALVTAFLTAENENRQPEDLLQAYFGRVPERFLLSVSTKSITKNFVCWKWRPLFIFVVFQRFLPSWALAPTHFTVLFGDCRSFYFYSLVKSTFLVGERLLCLYEKQNNTWLFHSMRVVGEGESEKFQVFFNPKPYWQTQSRLREEFNLWIDTYKAW